jgi:hypothetical protein
VRGQTCKGGDEQRGKRSRPARRAKRRPQLLSDCGSSDVDGGLAEQNAVWLNTKDVEILDADGVAVRNAPGSNAKWPPARPG